MTKKLYHSGKEGMHWYVRNGPPYPLKMSESKYKQISKAVDVAKGHYNTAKTNHVINQQRKSAYFNRANLSDDELRSITNRIMLENNLKNAIKNADNSLSSSYKNSLAKKVVANAVKSTPFI